MDTAKLFWSGRSQAVRLPKEFRMDATEVRIRRHGAAVILEPLLQGWDPEGWRVQPKPRELTAPPPSSQQLPLFS